jgi:hypothetical protein
MPPKTPRFVLFLAHSEKNEPKRGVLPPRPPSKSPLKKSRMLNGLTVVSGSRDIRIVKLLCIINVKNLHISLIFSTLAENFCNAWRL